MHQPRPHTTHEITLLVHADPLGLRMHFPIVFLTQPIASDLTRIIENKSRDVKPKSKSVKIFINLPRTHATPHDTCP
jgi:hypothetical protein